MWRWGHLTLNSIISGYLCMSMNCFLDYEGFSVNHRECFIMYTDPHQSKTNVQAPYWNLQGGKPGKISSGRLQMEINSSLLIIVKIDSIKHRQHYWAQYVVLNDRCGNIFMRFSMNSLMNKDSQFFHYIINS